MCYGICVEKTTYRISSSLLLCGSESSGVETRVLSYSIISSVPIFFFFKGLGCLWSRPHLFARQSKVFCLACCCSCWNAGSSFVHSQWMGLRGFSTRLLLTSVFYISRCWQNPNPRRWLPCELGKGVKSTDPTEWYCPLQRCWPWGGTGEGDGTRSWGEVRAEWSSVVASALECSTYAIPCGLLLFATLAALGP